VATPVALRARVRFLARSLLVMSCVVIGVRTPVA
jgi:hypothetical protein